MSADEVVDFGFRLRVHVLELVHGGEFDDVETVGQDTIGFPLEQVFALVGGDVADGGEDVRGVGCGALDAVSVVDTTLSCFVIDVKVLEVVVEVHRASAEISSEQRRVGGEYGGDIYVPLATEWDCQACLPLVEVGDDGLVKLTSNILRVTRAFVS